MDANLANLLDRAPGRVAKVALLLALPVALVAGVDERMAGPVVIVGATLALLWPDLREQLMLGDTGANVLGATLGLAVVLTTAFGLALGAMWEMVEWFGYAYLTDDIYVTYEDTVGDLAAGGLGSLLAGVLMARGPGLLLPAATPPARPAPTSRQR